LHPDILLTVPKEETDEDSNSITDQESV